MPADSSTSLPRVVFGDDASTGSDVAWLWLTSQNWVGYTLEVLTAQLPPLGPPVDRALAVPHPQSGPPPRHAPAEANFDSVEFLEVVADPRLALGECTDAALVVVGAAAAGFGPWHIGSTTEWLLNGPPAPLVIARRGQKARTALVCADGSPHAAAAAAAFGALPWAHGMAITVIGVDDGRTDVGASTAAIAEVLASFELEADVSHAHGKPHRAILAEAETRAADLVILGSRGLTVMRRLTLGSTASVIARHASASVLVTQRSSRTASPQSTATVVGAADGEVSMTDGPTSFAIR